MISYRSGGKCEFYMEKVTNTETVLIWDVISGKLYCAASCNNNNYTQLFKCDILINSSC
jgi:hypothetical protein